MHALAAEGGLLFGGGTDLFPAWVDRPTPHRVIDLKGIAELRGISTAGTSVRIGGSVTWSEIAAAKLPPSFGALQAAAREVGSVQIQNAATIAGNICNASPAADGVPPLLALDCEVELASLSGVRRLALSEFIRGNRLTARKNDELLTAFIIPKTHENARSVFLKLGARRYLVISIVMVAANIERDSNDRIVHAAVAVGAASEVARRLSGLERKLLVAPPGTPASSLVAAEDLPLSPIDDLRATASYRKHAALILVRRALEATNGMHDA